MSVYAIGLNHTTAPLAMREQFAFAEHDLGAALAQLRHALQAEVALLSTCNRTEVYVAPHQAVPQGDASAFLGRITQQLAQLKQLNPDALSKHSYQLHGSAPVRHAFRVASGLDSMVLGEPQILGQLKQAVRCAQDHGALGTQLHHLFQQSFAVAKQVRTQTGVGAASVSMAAAAVRLSQRIFGQLSQRRVLMVGAGEMIALCATHFAGHQPKQLTIANRSPARGQALVDALAKQGHSAQLMPLSQLADALHQYDIIVSCTASTMPIIGLGLVQRALAQKAAKRQPQTTMMVDLAVPRDIEPEVAKLADVYLYTVDDLGRVVQEGRDSRSAAVVHAERIIDEKVGEYSQWLASRRSVPLIQAIQQHAQTQRSSELDKALKQLALGADPAQLLEQLARQLSQKLLHASLNTAQSLATSPHVDDALLAQVQQSYAAHSSNGGVE